MTDASERISRLVRQTLWTCARGMILAVTAVACLPLFPVSLACVLLLPTGLGVVLAPKSLLAVRRQADRQRRLALDWSGVTIETPYRPRPVKPANVVKHSGANRAWVQLEYDHDRLVAIVGDDGAGGAQPRAGGGLQGIERRLNALDGTVAVTSPAGGPTQVTMELPCELSLART